MTERRISFAPGPAMLPTAVVTAFQAAVTTYGTTGLGILELGHRSTAFGFLMEDTTQRLRELTDIPDDYDILILHGGARMQFAMLPANRLAPDATADYLDSGHFGHAAAQEARTFGHVHLIRPDPDLGYRRLANPDTHTCATTPSYVHYTSNNTEVGTQYAAPPLAPAGTWFACDASSDLLTRPFDVRAHGIIYATAHKNLGTAGLGVVIIRRSLLTPVRDLPDFFRYDTHAKAQSRFNTPPITSVFTLNLMLQWVAEAGGVPEMARRSQAKAAMVYDAIDNSRLFTGLADPAHRSLVNVTFAAPTDDLHHRFLDYAASQGLDGLGGYRKVGHLRASLFNPISIRDAERLADVISRFDTRHA